MREICDHLIVLRLGILIANTLAFFIAVLFAYFTNSKYVFQAHPSRENFLKFMSMRIGTLFIDDGGMMLLASWGWSDLVAKCVINALIIGINYLVSKFFIFKKQ